MIQLTVRPARVTTQRHMELSQPAAPLARGTPDRRIGAWVSLPNARQARTQVAQLWPGAVVVILLWVAAGPALVICGHGAALSWIDGYEMAVNGLDAYPLPRA
jgi:hypothetical protein